MYLKWDAVPNPGIFRDVIYLKKRNGLGRIAALNHVTVIGVPACTVA